MLHAFIVYLAMSLAAGCVPPPTVYEYPNLGFRIVKGSIGYVNTKCDEQNVPWSRIHWDNGEVKEYGGEVYGCTDYKNSTIYVRWDCNGARAIVHELGHWDRSYSQKQVEEKFQWDE